MDGGFLVYGFYCMKFVAWFFLFAGILGFLRDFFIHPSIDDTYSLGKHDGKKIIPFEEEWQMS